MAGEIPENSLILLLPEEDADPCRRNMDMALVRRDPGQPVVYVRLGKLAPPKSRLSSVRIEVAA
jgi:hypothetical protein